MATSIQPYYLGRHTVIRMLTADDIRQLYLRHDVRAALASYQPWFYFGQFDLDGVIDRKSVLASFDPPLEIEVLVLHRRTSMPLGFMSLAGIDPINGKAEFSAAFFRARGSRPVLESIHWALVECFDRQSLHKLIFHTLPENRAANAMLEAIGARQEGVLREELASQEDGQRLDLVRHALLREDWLKGEARHRLVRLAPLAVNSA